MTFAVLADKVAQVDAETHVCNGGLVGAPFLDREAFEEDETFAIDEIVTHGCQVRGKCRKMEVFLNLQGPLDLLFGLDPINANTVPLRS